MNGAVLFPWRAVALVGLWVALAVAGDGFLRSAATDLRVATLGLGLLCYAATVPVALLTYRCATWSWVALLWSGLSLLLSLTIARAAFHEPLTLRRFVSAALLLLAMGLAE